jgi:endonuclease/exonuclease/phosphatase family metal-dependent hydrolase
MSRQSRPSFGGMVRILSYNVRYFGHSTRGLASTRRAMERIAEAIASLDPIPDIVCLQEVETQSIRSTLAHPLRHPEETQLGRFVEMLGKELLARGVKKAYEAYYFRAHAYKVREALPFYTTGLAILARPHLVVDHHNAGDPHVITYAHLHPIKGLKQTRICAHIRFRAKRGETLDVFNTHLSLPSTMSREFWVRERRMGYGPNQLQEAKNLVRFVGDQVKSERFLIVGDFNALPGSPVYRYLVGDAQLEDPFATLHRMNEDELRHWPTAGFMRMRMHLDHVFSGPGLRWLDFEGSSPFGDRESPFHRLSDHTPIIGRFYIGA